MMNAQDWDYIAEGGEHAIFAYHPKRTDIRDQSHNGKVLRIQKQILTMTNSHYSCDHHCIGIAKSEAKTKAAITTHSKSIERHEIFQQQFIQHVLKPYIDIPVPLTLSFDFVHTLYIKTMREDAVHRIIPTSRLKDWSLSASRWTDEANIVHTRSDLCTSSPIKASLYPNYRHSNRHYNDQYRYLHNDQVRSQSHLALDTREISTLRKTLSIEIKPKAGYIPCSPLIKPENRAKFFHTRFEILQQLYSKNIISKGWSSSSPSSSSIRTTSNYNPIDLFSKNLEDVQNAIKELFKCPQNNLKVIYDDTLLYGVTKNDDKCHNDEDEEAVRTMLLRDIFQVDDKHASHHQSISSSHSLDTIKILQVEVEELMSNILNQHSNSLLTRIQTLQRKFDALDYDGAITVYQRLIDLCDGSYDEAENLIDSNICSFFDDTNVKEAENRLSNHGLSDIHLYLGSNSQQVITYLNLCEEVEGYLSKYKLKDDNNNHNNIDRQILREMDSWYTRANGLVQKFSKDDCVGLLQNWLLSLMMCDLSFIITVSCPSNNVANKDNNNKNTTNRSKYNFYSTTMSEHKIVTKDGYKLDYQIKVIDIDGKPARKLRNRDKMENKIAQFLSTNGIFKNNNQELNID
jgi:exo-beta-1,3-glucanase (GH17 family)